LLSVTFFFEKHLLLQPEVVFDGESNDRNFSSPAPPGGEKRNVFRFFSDFLVIKSFNQSFELTYILEE